mmetsp:Transcript_58118/g.126344  ORF Transcript_58118/g.126344 Transcript_58118/m.126344 type:complete len:172 (-) Transcript_58118:25-540(-)
MKLTDAAMFHKPIAQCLHSVGGRLYFEMENKYSGVYILSHEQVMAVHQRGLWITPRWDNSWQPNQDQYAEKAGGLSIFQEMAHTGFRRVVPLHNFASFLSRHLSGRYAVEEALNVSVWSHPSLSQLLACTALALNRTGSVARVVEQDTEFSCPWDKFTAPTWSDCLAALAH